jgi:hypothetical protein
MPARATLASVEDVPTSKRPPAGPRFPFQDWPVQLSTSFGYVWYTSPGVFVSQLVIERARLEDARKLTSLIDEVIRIKQDDLKSHDGLLILHDWKILKTYDAPARGHLFAHTRTRKAGDVRAVVVSLTLTPLLRMAVEAGNALLTVTTGRSVEIVQAISSALGKYGVERPSDGRALRGLSA